MIKAIVFDFNRTIFDPDQKKLFPGAGRLLSQLKRKYRLGLFTTGGEERKKLIDELGLTNTFDFVLVVKIKTLESLKRCLQELKRAPCEALVVGDRVRKEIYLGNQLGMITVWLRQGKYAKEKPETRGQRPTFFIQSLGQLREILPIADGEINC